MQQAHRNPFALRASEKIADEVLFLKLFSGESLRPLIELHDQGKLWGNVIRICSAPGGGKTSILRLFSPLVIRQLMLHYQSYENFKILYNTLKKIGVFDTEDNHCSKCGVYLLIERDYEYLWELDLLLPQRRQMLFALLNARICLSVIKTIMQLFGMKFSDLEEVCYTPPVDNLTAASAGLDKTLTGKELYTWAAGLEDSICNYLDAITSEEPVGQTSIFAFDLFKACNFTYQSNPICEEFIFMLDDVHKLGEEMFNCLSEQVVETRKNASIFLSGRKEVLPTEDLMSPVNKEGRDYLEIQLDAQRKTKRIFDEVSNYRSLLSSYTISLMTALQKDVNSNYDKIYKRVIEDSKKQLDEKQVYDLYEKWCEAVDSSDDSYATKAAQYRAIVIFASREVPRLFPYEEDEMKHLIDNDLLSLSTILMRAKYNIPLYYGFDTLKELAFNNVEQFLTFASEMFERLIGKSINSQYLTLDAKEQDSLVRDVCKREFERIKLLPHGRDVQKFLTKLLKYCYDKTNSDSASYRVVTGFAVYPWTQQNEWYKQEEHKRLADVIKVCVANNLLTVRYITQGAPTEQWKVFYLNRYLCAYKHIPLTYGGWSKLRLEELSNWLIEK